MDFKGYLYMGCAIAVAVGGMNIARRGIPGPGTLLVFLVPLIGLIVLFSLDAWAFFQSRRGNDDRPRKRKRRRSRHDGDIT